METWRALFRELMPDLELVHWASPMLDPASIRYALVWEPDPGQLKNFSNLRLIMSATAGIDHILRDPALPRGIRITRMIIPETEERMADYVCAAAYSIIRDFPMIARAQAIGRWDDTYKGRRSSETRIAVLGLGQLGLATARRLALVGFNVSGWSRSWKSVANVRCFVGREGWLACTKDADIVVNLLPGTAETKGLIDAAFLSHLRHGASLINVGRASTVDIDALITHLAAGALRYAFLDVFEHEPLRSDDSLWSIPNVFVSAHIASRISMRSKAEQVVKWIRADRSGAELEHVSCPHRGY